MSTITTPRPETTRSETRTKLDPPVRGGPLDRALEIAAAWLAAHSVLALRVSLGLVIAGFGSLKFFPGASPAEALVMQTTDVLTFGMVGGTTAVVITAVLEVFIGFTLITGVGLRAGLLVTVGWLGGILSPVVLFPGEMFPGGLPTLTAQYVLKDIILVAAVAVVAAQALGARMVRR